MRSLRDTIADGPFVKGNIRTLAAQIGISERTAWRWLRQAKRGETPPRPGRKPTQVDAEDFAALADCRGNVAEFARRKASAGHSVHYPAWRRAIKRTGVDPIAQTHF